MSSAEECITKLKDDATKLYECIESFKEEVVVTNIRYAIQEAEEEFNKRK